MTVLWVLVFSVTACLLAGMRRSPWRGARPIGQRAGRTVRRGGSSPEELPRLVRQLSSLLAAGRSGPKLWEAMGLVLLAEQSHDQTMRGNAGTFRGPEEARPLRAGPDARPNPTPTLQLVLAVHRASVLGLPMAEAIRRACLSQRAAPNRFGIWCHRSGKVLRRDDVDRGAALAARKGLLKRPVLSAEQDRVWLDIAACFEVCEASGAPLAAVLDRLAASIEADQDAQAQRETALAGPRATVRLLSWLPFLGLGLGLLMGVDPVGTLLGTGLGWVLLLTGLGLALAGRMWSAAMIAQAATAESWRDRSQRRSQNRNRATEGSLTGYPTAQKGSS